MLVPTLSGLKVLMELGLFSLHTAFIPVSLPDNVCEHPLLFLITQTGQGCFVAWI